MPEKLKKGWTCVAFGDVVQLCRERSSNPLEEGFDRYVGLEHLEPGDLKIRHWGNVADGTTFTNVFHSGQVLFGKRRAYQRKVALADFDGVCSGDIYVFQPKNEELLPELLPFICQTDAFFEHAVGTSAGSLSPRTNWESLASYEFALPPLEEQRRIAAVLGAAQSFSESLARLAHTTSTVRDSWLEKELTSLARTVPEKRASEVIEKITVGIVVKPADLYVAPSQGVPTLRSLNVAPGRLVLEDMVFISKKGHSEHAKSRLQAGDLVIVRSGRPGDAAVVGDGLGELNCIDLIICGASQQIVPHFLCAVLNSAFGRRQFSSGTAGTAQQHFNVGAFKQFRLPVPPLTVQAHFVDRLRELEVGTVAAQQRAKEFRDLHRRIIEEVLQQ